MLFGLIIGRIVIILVALVGLRPPNLCNESKSMSDEKHVCSFCGKSEHEVKNLIEGEHAFICNECVETCGVMLQGQFDDEGETPLRKRVASCLRLPKSW